MIYSKQFVVSEKDDTGIDPRVVAYYSPQVVITEQYRSVRTYLNSIYNGGSGARVLMLTSANRAEGRSITAANLAFTLAEEKEKRVILVNTDFRYPTIEKLLNLPSGPGLSNYLVDGGAVDQIILQTAMPNLRVIPVGTAKINPAEILASLRMKDLIERLRLRFDYIILDSPAFIPFADGRILCPLVDGVLLIVQACRTRREVVWRMQEQLDSLRVKLLGVILSNVEYYIPDYIHRHL